MEEKIGDSAGDEISRAIVRKGERLFAPVSANLHSHHQPARDFCLSLAML